jgi:hypothetical protein
LTGTNPGPDDDLSAVFAVRLQVRSPKSRMRRESKYTFHRNELPVEEDR